MIITEIGLFGAFLLSVTLAIFGGRMAMITSVTGSTALLMTGIVQQGENISPGLGLQYLLAAGLLTGVLQIAMRKRHLVRFWKTHTAAIGDELSGALEWPVTQRCFSDWRQLVVLRKDARAVPTADDLGSLSPAASWTDHPAPSYRCEPLLIHS